MNPCGLQISNFRSSEAWTPCWIIFSLCSTTAMIADPVAPCRNFSILKENLVATRPPPTAIQQWKDCIQKQYWATCVWVKELFRGLLKNSDVWIIICQKTVCTKHCLLGEPHLNFSSAVFTLPELFSSTNVLGCTEKHRLMTLPTWLGHCRLVPHHCTIYSIQLLIKKLFEANIWTQ